MGIPEAEKECAGTRGEINRYLGHRFKGALTLRAL